MWLRMTRCSLILRSWLACRKPILSTWANVTPDEMGTFQEDDGEQEEDHRLG